MNTFVRNGSATRFNFGSTSVFLISTSSHPFVRTWIYGCLQTTEWYTLMEEMMNKRQLSSCCWIILLSILNTKKAVIMNFIYSFVFTANNPEWNFNLLVYMCIPIHVLENTSTRRWVKCWTITLNLDADNSSIETSKNISTFSLLLCFLLVFLKATITISVT